MSFMQIGKVFERITSLGPGNRLVIWVVGCNRRCEGCVSPELRTPDPSTEIDLKDFCNMLDFFFRF